MTILVMMKQKEELESLGPIQGPQETQMEIRSRQLRASLKRMEGKPKVDAAALWKGTADQLSSDYN